VDFGSSSAGARILQRRASTPGEIFCSKELCSELEIKVEIFLNGRRAIKSNGELLTDRQTDRQTEGRDRERQRERERERQRERERERETDEHADGEERRLFHKARLIRVIS
jgi:hypothetical protein